MKINTFRGNLIDVPAKKNHWRCSCLRVTSTLYWSGFYKVRIVYHHSKMSRLVYILYNLFILKSLTIFGTMQRHHTSSVAVLAEISLRSPRKIFVYIIKKYIDRIKVSKK